MNWNLVTDSELRQLPISDRLLVFADSYLNASFALTQQMASDAALCTWPNGTVALMLAAHSVELFLKGAILKRAPNANVWDHAHDIDALTSDYNTIFSEPSFDWNIPFKKNFPEDILEEELRALKKQSPPPSILYRYPVQKGGAEWKGVFAFEPRSFLVTLQQMRDDIARIESQLS
jgi:hypothetical protein